MRTWWKYILDLFLPPRCKKCGKIICDDDALCDDCFNELNFISAPYCQRCGRPFEDISGLKHGHLLCPDCAREKHPWFRFGRAAVHYDDFSSDFMFGSSGNDEELPEDDSANDLMNEAIPLEISDIAFVLMGVSLIAISAIYSKSRKKSK